MITAVDTNILLDILIPDKTHFSSSKKLLDEYIDQGRLIICEIVYSELASQFLSETELKDFLADTGISITYSDEKTLYLAGHYWRSYVKNRRSSLQCSNCGITTSVFCPKCKSLLKLRQHIISDFIIGAHALVHSGLLLSRDRGFYRTYFKDLKTLK